MTLTDIRNATFLQGSEGGFTHSISQDGRAAAQCGQAHALANLSARQVKALGLQTSGIYGPHGSILLHSENLQRCLESKLRAELQTTGSTLFNLTWKAWVTPLGRRRIRQRASVRSSSAKGATGLPMHLPRPSGTSNHGRNHVAGRLDEWGGSGNPFRGTPLGKTHSPSFELWIMGYPDEWAQQTPRATLLSLSRQHNLLPRL